MKLFKRITSTILIISILISGYFVWNFHPDRAILGYKTFYNKDAYRVSVGRATSRTPKIGESIILYQDEQADYGEVIDIDNLTIDVDGDFVSATDNNSIVYEILFSFNAIYVGVLILLIVVIETIVDKMRKRKLKENV